MKVTEKHHAPKKINFSAFSNSNTNQENLTADAVNSEAVDVKVEKISERQRRISAKIHILRPIEQVWKVLTDYEALTQFVPNLVKSRLLPHPTGGIRLEQIGSGQLLRMNFSARVVLDLEEYFPDKICFEMVEGDFKVFCGSWLLAPIYLEGEVATTSLCYTIEVLPRLTMPVGLIERRMSDDLRSNLLAIRQQTENLFSYA